MKKVFFLIVFLFSFSIQSIAQPILTKNNIAPQSGQVFSIINLSNQSPGFSGPNQVWDLSNASTVGNSTINVNDASSSPNAGNFPNANIVSFHSGNGEHSFFQINTNEWEYYGLHTSLSISYSNPQTVLKFPFTYNDALVDTFYCVFNVGYNIYRMGFVTIEADSYGSLVLPSGTYTNVLRVHYTINTKDSSQNGVTNYTQEYYYWYKEWNYNPIAFMDISAGGYYLENIVNSVVEKELSYSIKIFPNPATNELTIVFSELAELSAKVELFSIHGKTIITETIYIEQNKIDISSLPSGLYFITISTPKHTYTRKILKE